MEIDLRRTYFPRRSFGLGDFDFWGRLLTVHHNLDTVLHSDGVPGLNYSHVLLRWRHLDPVLSVLQHLKNYLSLTVVTCLTERTSRKMTIIGIILTLVTLDHRLSFKTLTRNTECQMRDIIWDNYFQNYFYWQKYGRELQFWLCSQIQHLALYTYYEVVRSSSSFIPGIITFTIIQFQSLFQEAFNDWV